MATDSQPRDASGVHSSGLHSAGDKRSNHARHPQSSQSSHTYQSAPYSSYAQAAAPREEPQRRGIIQAMRDSVFGPKQDMDRKLEKETEDGKSETSRSKASTEENGYILADKVAELEAENRRLEEENSRRRRGNNTLKHKVDAYRDRLEKMRQEYKTAMENGDDEKRRASHQYGDLAVRYGALEKELKQKSALLDTRTTELRTAETFLSSYDEIPGDEIVSLVSDLNQLVLGIAEKYSEVFPFEESAPRSLKNDVDLQISEYLAGIIGAPLVNLLRSKGHSEDPTIVQLAIQSALVFELFKFTDRWPIPTSQSGSFSKKFWKLYSSIHNKEMQAVAARWRALGSKYLRDELEVNFEEMVSNSSNDLHCILQASGAQFNLSPQFSEEQLRGDLERLWRHAGTVAEKTKEAVLSTDYKLIFVPPGSDFDDRIAKAQGAVEKRSRVLCPTELGLMRVTGNEKPGGGSGQLETSVISKATVIFEHEIEAMFA